MRVDPYLYFQGRCEEAFAFYRRAVGAEVQTLIRFRDMPQSQAPSVNEDKVMHAVLRIGDTTVLASDGQSSGTTRFDGFALALSTPDQTEAEQRFAALAEGGVVQMPLTSTPFAARFGMVVDRFGVSWTVVTQAAPAAS